MERRRLSGFLRRPTEARIRELAAEEYMHLSPEEAASMAILVDRYLHFADRLDDLPEPELPVSYPRRDKGSRPTPEEDPHNVFIRKCRVSGSPNGRLQGVRVGVKDNISVAAIPCTNGSRMMEGYVPNLDATVVERLLDAGATIVGKLNCDDFSFSGTGETSHFGVVTNPHNTAFSAGGSSSGAGAAVVLDEVDLALGVDNGGSGRIPASWCGVVCMKATHGLVPTFGITYVDHTTDFICPIARNVRNVALALEVIAGDEPKDAQWVRGPIRTDAYTEDLGQPIDGMRIGVLRESLKSDELEPDVEAAYHEAIRTFESLGATCREVSLPLWSDAQAIWTTFAAHGISVMVESNLEGYGRGGMCNVAWQDAFAKARFASSDRLPPVLKVLMIVGKYLRRDYGSTYFGKATNLRFAFRQQMDRLLDEEFDILATPTTPTKAFRLVDHPVSLREVVESRATSMAMNTYPTNVSGHPSLSLPCGVGENNLPIGLQLVGAQFGERRLFQAGSALEAALRATDG